MHRQLAEQMPESLVLLMRQALVAEEDDEVLHQRVVHFLELLIAERARQVDAADLRADMRRQLPDLDCLIGHGCSFVAAAARHDSTSAQTSARTTRAGLPSARVFGGTSRVTTLPAPITAPSPIVTPGSTIAPPPIQTPLPIRIGLAYSRPAARVSRSSGW